MQKNWKPLVSMSLKPFDYSFNQKNNLKKFIRELFVKGQIIRTTTMATNTGKIQTLTFDIIIIQPANWREPEKAILSRITQEKIE